ncbi:MAG: GH25 family lysozyme [Phaeodactylibacter sp.]|uniref:glycoside hydrolase family 25 protein n=1 Tax=Phaeodactylibacter sp. TaxID=1940289 RepID=UPI0032EE0E3C
MPGYEVHGIDVSHYQADIDWNVVAAQGVQFAFVKASEGMTLIDTLFCENWFELKEANIRRGAYHFFRPRTPVFEQAMNFQTTVKIESSDLPPVLDVEVLDGVSKVELVSSVLTWLYLTEIHYGVKPILYTNLKFYNKYLAGHFDEYPLWIARYSRREPTLACGREWQFWQYGNRGSLEGIEGPVDFNVFQGDLHKLDSLCYYPAPVLSDAL